MSDYHSEIRTLFIVTYCFVIPVIFYVLVESAGPKPLRDRLRAFQRPVRIVIALGALIILVWRLILFLNFGR